MPDLGWFVVAVVAVAVVPLVGGLLMRRRVQDRLYAGTGLSQWRAEAPTFSWRDRRTMQRANSRGRAAPRRLAAPAARRAAAYLAAVERTVADGSPLRRFWRVFLVFWVAMLVFWVVLLLVGGSSLATWLNLAVTCYWLVFSYSMSGPVPRYQARRLRASHEANRRLADDHATSDRWNETDGRRERNGA